MKVGRTSVRSYLIRARLSAKATSEPTMMGAHSTSRPSTCASGRNRYCRSVGRRSKARTALSHEATRFAWVSTTPLGCPVVPEV